VLHSATIHKVIETHITENLKSYITELMGRIYPKTLHSATTQKIINIQIIVNYLKSYINNIYGEDISQNTIQDNNAKDH
jgi:hypothetical protein